MKSKQDQLKDFVGVRELSWDSLPHISRCEITDKELLDLWYALETHIAAIKKIDFYLSETHKGSL